MKYKQTAVIFILMLVLSIMLSKEFHSEFEVVDTGASKYLTDGKEKITGQESAGQVSNIIYNKDGIEAEYPKLVSGGSEKELRGWNQLIEEDFNKILKIYFFRPNPELTPVPAYLKIKYKIERNDADFISILYTVSFNSPYSAHPTELIYTTNINKAKNKRIILSDIVKLDKEFVNDFRTWEYLPMMEDNDELNKAIKDYVSNMSDKDLLMGFKTSDIIGTGNIWGIYSYLTDDSLGISLGVPHYIGDHVEFEMKYSELKKFLKSDFTKLINNIQ
jgi:hypothetical protein